MSYDRNKVVAQARSWLGRNEASGTHKYIIDVYNSQKLLPRNYKVKYTDAWCATFVSAVALIIGYTKIIPTECGVEQQINLFKVINSWNERDDYVPKPGDVIYYDWNDSGVGDNTGWADHVGIVEKVSGGTITVIEGNYKDSVARRYIKVNAKFIRGYGVPKYDSDVMPFPEFSDGITVELLQLGSIGSEVKTMQQKLSYLGYDIGKYGADGEFGNDTLSAVKSFQKDQNIVVDGVVGEVTSKALNIAYEAKKNNQTKGPDKTEVLFKGKIATEKDPLSIRVWAGTEFGNLKAYPTLPKGTIVEVMNYTQKDKNGDEWYYIRYHGIYGFAKASYIKRV